MKKHLYLMPVLALSMATFALAGCDDKKDEQAAAPAGTETPVAESAMPAAEAVAATIVASDAVAYATPLGSINGAVFVTLQNPQSVSDSLTAASTDVAESVEIHQPTTDAAGTSSMNKVDAIEILAGQHVRLAPDGYHLMLIGLKSPLTEGQTFNVALTFANAGQVTVPVSVVAAGSDTSSDAHEGHTDDAAEAESTVPVDETPVTETAPTADEAPAAPETTTTTEPAPADSTSGTTAE
jgi:hypothetical protein